MALLQVSIKRQKADKDCLVTSAVNTCVLSLQVLCGPLMLDDTLNARFSPTLPLGYTHQESFGETEMVPLWSLETT